MEDMLTCHDIDHPNSTYLIEETKQYVMNEARANINTFANDLQVTLTIKDYNPNATSRLDVDLIITDFEWCNRTSAVKYVFKYITKGVDRATAIIENGNTAATSDATGSGGSKEKVVSQRNEIQDYIEARYLSACESMWRTFAFHIHKRKPSVEKLIIHLEGEHNQLQ